jgi:predicted DNA-binding protein
MKEKVIHTRVSEDLYEKILNKSKKHRITMSNLIRNVVEDGLEIYNDVADVIDEKVREKIKEKKYKKK